MEFSSLGAHCAAKLCKQRDFLPFTCDACKGSFCLDHRTYVGHSCTQATGRDHRAVVCPLCAGTIHFVDGEDVHAQFEAHRRDGCRPELRETRIKRQRCAAPGCKTALLLSNHATCSQCQRELCLAHRHADDHACRGRASTTSGLLSRLYGSGTAAPAAPPPAPVPARPRPAVSAPVAGAAMHTAPHAVSGAAGGAPRAVTATNRSSAPQSRGRIAPSAIYAATAAEAVRQTAARRMQAAQLPPSEASASGSRDSAEVNRCPECGLTFGTVGELINHAESGPHPAAGGHERCPRCGVTFSTVAALVQHSETCGGAIATPPVASGGGGGGWGGYLRGFFS